METKQTKAKKYSDIKARTTTGVIVIAFYLVYILLSFFASYQWVKGFIEEKFVGIVFFVLGFISLLMLTVVLFFVSNEITRLFFHSKKSCLIWTTCVMFVLLYTNSLFYLVISNFYNPQDDFPMIFKCFVGLVFASAVICYVTNTIFVSVLSKKKQLDKKAIFWFPFLTTIMTLFLIAFLYVSVIHEWTTIMILLLIPTLSDIFGYLVGSKAGKHKLAPTISPKKSWEGLTVGSYLITLIIICGIIACFVYADNSRYRDSHWAAHVFLGCQTCSCIHFYNSQPYFWSIYVLVTFFLITLSVFGDLFFSYTKRLFKIKDFSNLLPGHGGILDRIDSLVFVFIVYFLVTIILQASTREGITEAALLWNGIF